MSYSMLAEFYDRLQEADYDEIGAYYHKLLVQNNAISGILLDLACGTGKLSRYFADLGYDIIGADISPEMLSIAIQNPHTNIQYLQQDMTRLNLFGTIDACICTLDALNHLPDKRALRKTFEKISLFMNSGGMFIFDINTLHKHNEMLSGKSFVFDLNDVYCGWQNSCCESGKVDITLDIFAREGNLWRKYTEKLSEQAYPISEITQMLTETGFGEIKIYEWLSENEGDENCEKVVFTARKYERANRNNKGKS